ncbi:DEAD/DEAH box helicase family protein [Streptomyces sp. NBC_00989]|uniref:DEAD/DEAH box helicase family protein n=1 Tax=Streptomyces sp. NBC_00989 TaxID=2903705 RepID=UPI002F90D94E|nr:DEAD/DEAH box helicase family protein [Streptomyces sp. NBC_00989]
MHAARGTGKAIIAAASAKRLVPKERVLVLVPTLDLLAQTNPIEQTHGSFYVRRTALGAYGAPDMAHALCSDPPIGTVRSARWRLAG